jgi:hypothetical protein
VIFAVLLTIVASRVTPLFKLAESIADQIDSVADVQAENIRGFQTFIFHRANGTGEFPLRPVLETQLPPDALAEDRHIPLNIDFKGSCATARVTSSRSSWSCRRSSPTTWSTAPT